MSSSISVLVVDDDALVRAGLSMMLTGADDIRVVAEAADGAEAISAVNKHRPDVVLMDIRMPRMDGLTATERLRARQEPPEIIILTTFDTNEHVIRALRSGASGFLLKHTPPTEIITAIKRVAAGEPILSPSVLRQVMSQIAQADADPRQAHARKALDQLSDKERTVARLIGQGQTNAEISREMLVSIATVKAYVSRLLTKLKLNNRVQIALLVHDATEI